MQCCMEALKEQSFSYKRAFTPRCHHCVGGEGLVVRFPAAWLSVGEAVVQSWLRAQHSRERAQYHHARPNSDTVAH